MATELFDFLAMTVKDDITEIMNFNGFKVWRRMVARCAPTDPATAWVAVMRVVSPQRSKGLKE